MGGALEGRQGAEGPTRSWPRIMASGREEKEIITWRELRVDQWLATAGKKGGIREA